MKTINIIFQSPSSVIKGGKGEIMRTKSEG